MAAPRRIPRAVHPIAWWIWAIGLATAASRTTNVLLLLLILAVLGFVVSHRRTDAPWARAFRYYLYLALVVIAVRVLFRSVFATGMAPTDHILFRLPRLTPPEWYAGVQIGGAVSLEAALAAATDGLRLAVLLCCVGAANTLANPKRALRVLPGALYELGVAVTVAISVAPQLIESLLRVRRARRLRAGRGRGVRALRSLVVPVLEEALDRSLRLAAAMDSRGYGRAGTTSRGSRRITAAALLAGMLALCAGVFGLLDAAGPRLLGLPTLLGGSLLCAVGLAVGSRRVRRTSYRPDPWRRPEWLVAACGIVPAVVLIGTGAADLNPAFPPLHWPTLPLAPTIAILVAALPAVVTPPPMRRPAAASARLVAERTKVSA
jgi:energy-coupling factor transport system permease protein